MPNKILNLVKQSNYYVRNFNYKLHKDKCTCNSCYHHGSNIRYTPYYTKDLTVPAIQESITTILSRIKNSEEKRQAVLASDGMNKNCLHHILSGTLLRYTCGDNTYFLPPEAFNKPIQVGNTPDPAPITMENYKAQQNARLHTLVSTVLTPFVITEDAKENEIRNAALYHALGADAHGQTVLHYALDNMSLQDPFAPLLERIAHLNDEQKLNLMTHLNHEGKNILHLALTRWRAPTLTALYDAFGAKAISAASRQRDNLGNTPFHTMCSQTFTCRSTLLENLPAPLRPSAEILAMQNHEQKNALFLACSFNTPALVNTVCDRLEEKAEDKEPGETPTKKSDAVGAPTLMGLNTAHCAAMSGNDNVLERVLRHIPATEAAEIAAKKTNAQWTLLHYACRYGTKVMIDRVIATLGPINTHRIAHLESAKLLPQLLAQNPNNIPIAVFNTAISNKTHWIEGYDYLVARFQESNYCSNARQQDKEARITDFIGSIVAKINKSALPHSPPSFHSQTYCFGLFASSDRYLQKKNKFQDADHAETIEFFNHLKTETKCPIACRIVKAVTMHLELASRPSSYAPLR